MSGGVINFNNGPSALTATSQGSIVRLEGDVISIGTTALVRANAVVPKAELDLAGAARTFDITGTMTIAPDVKNGDIFKIGTGTLTLNGANPTYTSINASAGTTNVNGSSLDATIIANAAVNFGVSQTLTLLSIGSGAVVTLGTPAPAPLLFEEIGGGEGAGVLAEGAVAAVPEPCGSALLLGGLATLLGLRRRK